MRDLISRQTVLELPRNRIRNMRGEIVEETINVEYIEQLPSAQPESTRTFVELVVEYPDPELCTYKEYKGKPYYSIKYIENGETYVGYGTYNPEVLSQYLREYFISSTQPDLCDGCDRYGASCVGEGCGKLEMPEVAKDTNVPNNDCISRQAAIDAVNNIMPTKEGFLEPSEVLCELMQLPSAQPEPCEDVVSREYLTEHIEACWMNGRMMIPDLNEVLSWIDDIPSVQPSAQPDITPDGTLKVTVDADIASVGRILLSQTGTQYGGLYYKDAQPEIIRCKDCKYHMQNDYGDSWCIHPKGLDQFDLKPKDFCSRGKRRTDGTEQP